MDTEKRHIGEVTKASAMGGAVALVVQWLVTILFGIEMPEGVALAFSIIFTGMGTLIGGWLVRPGNGNRRAE